MQEEEKRIKDELRIRPFPVIQEVKFPERIEEQQNKMCLEELISKTFEEVKQQMCDNYCRHTVNATPEVIEGLWDSEICNNCPLGRL